MSFNRDWNESNPIDHSKNSTWPGYIRQRMVDVSDRLKSMFYGFISGESSVGVKVLPFVAQSTPNTVTDQIQLYGKVVGGKTELHAKDEDGNEFQITDLGAVKTPSAAALWALVGPLAYPVGKIVALYVSTNPNTLFGFGTWVAIEGETLVGFKSGDPDFGTLGTSVGEKVHTLLESEMPPHIHAGSAAASNGSAGGGNYAITDALNTNKYLDGTGSTGGGAAHNNIQPSRVVYLWRRSA